VVVVVGGGEVVVVGRLVVVVVAGARVVVVVGACVVVVVVGACVVVVVGASVVVVVGASVVVVVGGSVDVVVSGGGGSVVVVVSGGGASVVVVVSSGGGVSGGAIGSDVGHSAGWAGSAGGGHSSAPAISVAKGAVGTPDPAAPRRTAPAIRATVIRRGVEDVDTRFTSSRKRPYPALFARSVVACPLVTQVGPDQIRPGRTLISVQTPKSPTATSSETRPTAVRSSPPSYRPGSPAAV
jgi:hypothetical protein